MDAGHSADRSNDFGGRMKRLREERGIALRDIAETTKISVSALEALERNDVSRLPGGIFSRGFVRAYAEQKRWPATLAAWNNCSERRNTPGARWT